MADRISELSNGMIRNMLSDAYRYDKIFCDLLDQGLTPDEASAKAKELVREPIKPL